MSELVTRKYDSVFQVRLTREQLVRWRAAGEGYRNGDESGLSALIRDVVEQRLADKSANVSVGWRPEDLVYTASVPPPVAKPSVTASKSPYDSSEAAPERKAFDKACTNKAYHWKGPCRFCGGS